MESNAQFRVAKHVQDLVLTHMPSGVSNQHVQRYTQYCMRILSSRIESLQPGDSDATHIKSMINRKSKFLKVTFKVEQKAKKGSTQNE